MPARIEFCDREAVWIPVCWPVHHIQIHTFKRSSFDLYLSPQNATADAQRQPESCDVFTSADLYFASQFCAIALDTEEPESVKPSTRMREKKIEPARTHSSNTKPAI